MELHYSVTDYPYGFPKITNKMLAFENIFCGKDVFPGLPTGFGKSKTDISNFAFCEKVFG